MHAKKRNPFKINSHAAVVYSLALTALLIIIGGGVYLGAHRTSSSSNSEIIQTVAQPPTAKQIAADEHCAKFTDIAVSQTASSLGVLDLGTCYVGTTKYAINTFASPASRDSWLKVSEPFGVNPKWETSTSVTYKSVG